MAEVSDTAVQARRLTTHVLDTASGRPAAGVDLEVFLLEGSDFKEVARATTNPDGRCDEPLLSGSALRPGTYEIWFHIGAYFDRQTLRSDGFLSVVPVRFDIGVDVPHVHVPLLISPFGYTTYRGS
ncbi:hydroxyisourate hydrolase [Methylorubrum populi]|uniref:5-hydroxyisourate hydrolase n=1 Tax=Methylorubrum populi TaxID=223967 RepID=A0A833IZU7_9HYPH|nr:hydroxyisourate hydrolase [Methylorubrum populi]KAB7781953.1 5-hydroxyisourate hydrolase [Methylorubrum populi]